MIIHTNFEPIFFCIHFIENIVNLIIGLIIYPQILAKLPALGFAAHQSDAVALLEGQLVLPGGHVGVKGLHQGTLIAALIVTQSGQLLLDDLVFVACQS